MALVVLHPEVDDAVQFMVAVSDGTFHNLVTDRDGTINNYCDRYHSWCLFHPAMLLTEAGMILLLSIIQFCPPPITPPPAFFRNQKENSGRLHQTPHACLLF